MYCSSDAQCKNGGSCIFDSCICAYGYSGTHCENRLQCASDFHCFQRGKCELDLQTNTTFCNCNSNSSGRYGGVFCEKTVPCHASGFCLNGGLCRRDSVATNVFYCACPDGFVGSNCQDNTFCHRQPGFCRHGGICQYLSIKKASVCSCDKNSGYSGYFCTLGVTPGMSWFCGGRSCPASPFNVYSRIYKLFEILSVDHRWFERGVKRPLTSNPTNPPSMHTEGDINNCPYMEQSAGEQSSGENWALDSSRPVFVNKSTNEEESLNPIQNISPRYKV